MIVHTGVRIILCQAIFLSDFIMPQLHFCSPRFLTGLPRSSLSLHFCIFPPVPHSFTFAAAEAANQNGNDDDTGQHRHGDDQYLEVDPAHPPSCIIQGTKAAGGQDVLHWVVNASLIRRTPQTCHILQAFRAAAVGSVSTRNRSWSRSW